MAQKDKVKELVGRGLGSYHTKALQQIDRIERKNKEQNHKINILTNELDNDYITKTEEGSVISLEHSKEGMIYLDELQGNTLVNYCVDGAKELTLNGDIGVEGTNVTLTEGVDNGKVDVMCEGNTLINTIGKFKSNGGSPIITDEYIQLSRGAGDAIISNGIIWKPNTVYTFVYTILETNFTNANGLTLSQNSKIINTKYIHGTTVGTHKEIFTTKDDSSITTNGLVILISSSQSGSSVIKLKDLYVLEGDWTDKEIPPYFEGMKSVGECEDNKIEILSQNKNLWYFGDLNIGCTYLTNPDNSVIIPSGTYTVSSDCEQLYEKPPVIVFRDIDKKTIKSKIALTSSSTITLDRDVYNIGLFSNDFNWAESTDKPMNFINIQVEKGTNPTDYVKHELNKKEISLNEPLRGLPNGVKDKFIKQSNKWYIERNLCEYKITGEENILTYDANSENAIIQYYITGLPNMIVGTSTVNGISDKFNFIKTSDRFSESSHNHLWCGNSHIALMYLKSANLTTSDVQNLLRGTTVVYQLATPTYEEITDVELITYLDTTHISNNSTIPCNMVVKNSGYNAIIKPSTLYTVALDTNKSGTVGINLGGATVTTTNNVTTITTPSTLTDDSLRLYGKGIKASKVRLLEGDKTNWIPSYFEGMQSCFEDKLQDDGTYKMEILSGNENKITKEYIELMKDVSNYGSGAYRNLKYYIQLEPQTRYTVSCKEYRELAGSYNLLQFTDYDSPNKVLGGFPYQNNASGTSDIVFENRSFTITTGLNGRICFRMYINNWTDKELVKKTIESIKDLKIEKGGKTPYVEGKSNKIQFSSIEPLRSLPNGVKDKFIFKNGKLMIERNTSKSKVNNIENVNKSYGGWNNIVFAYKVEGLISVGTSIRNVWSNLLPSIDIAELCNTLGKTGIASHNWGNGKLQIAISGIDTVEKMKEWISKNDLEIVYQIEPTYEEIPFELQKIILEGYENGTLFFDTNIPPTSTVTYAGETPIVKSVRLNKTEVLNNTNDINDNIVPYLMDMDYRVVCLQLEGGIENISMARLFGGTYEMLQRDILSNRYSKEEYKYRLDAYLSANKITHEEYTKLGDMLND